MLVNRGRERCKGDELVIRVVLEEEEMDAVE